MRSFLPDNPTAPQIPTALAEIGRPLAFAKGKYFYQPADRMESVYIIRSGLVKIGGYGPQGDEVIYDLGYPGEFCGNLKYLGGGRFQEFVWALTPVRATSYDLRAFKRQLHTDQHFHDWFMRVMVMRWARTEARLFRISSMSPEDRLRVLLEEITIDGTDGRELLSQIDLANLTGMTRQTVAKILARI